jgi:PHYB activation tagged suppressor 1
LPTKKNTSSWKLDKEIRKNLVTLIGRRQEATDDERLQGCAKDLLGLMINAGSKGGRRGQPVSPITVNDIVEECKTFFFAGKQTTSNLLTWITVVLAMHPEWQERARQEVLDVCGAHDIPCREQLAKLKTVSTCSLTRTHISAIITSVAFSGELTRVVDSTDSSA